MRVRTSYRHGGFLQNIVEVIFICLICCGRITDPKNGLSRWGGPNPPLEFGGKVIMRCFSTVRMLNRTCHLRCRWIR